MSSSFGGNIVKSSISETISLRALNQSLTLVSVIYFFSASSKHISNHSCNDLQHLKQLLLKLLSMYQVDKLRVSLSKTTSRKAERNPPPTIVAAMILRTSDDQSRKTKVGTGYNKLGWFLAM